MRANGCLSKPVLPSGSIGAGCRRANSLARVILHDVLRSLHERHPMVPIRQYVDDLVARCEGTARLISRWLPPAVEELAHRLETTDLTMSYSKSCVAGSDPKVAAAVHQALQKLGINFKLEVLHEVPDLGVGQSGGRRRLGRKWKGRLTKALQRGKRPCRLRFRRVGP